MTPRGRGGGVGGRPTAPGLRLRGRGDGVGEAWRAARTGGGPGLAPRTPSWPPSEHSGRRRTRAGGGAGVRSSRPRGGLVARRPSSKQSSKRIQQTKNLRRRRVRHVQRRHGDRQRRLRPVVRCLARPPRPGRGRGPRQRSACSNMRFVVLCALLLLRARPPSHQAVPTECPSRPRPHTVGHTTSPCSPHTTLVRSTAHQLRPTSGYHAAADSDEKK